MLGPAALLLWTGLVVIHTPATTWAQINVETHTASWIQRVSDRAEVPAREVTHHGNLQWQAPNVPRTATPEEREGARRASIQRNLSTTRQPAVIPTRRMPDDPFADPFGDRDQSSAQDSAAVHRQLEQACEEPSITLAAFAASEEPAKADPQIALIPSQLAPLTDQEPVTDQEIVRQTEPRLKLDVHPEPSPPTTLHMRAPIRLSPPTDPSFELQGPQLARRQSGHRATKETTRPVDWQQGIPNDWAAPPAAAPRSEPDALSDERLLDHLYQVNQSSRAGSPQQTAPPAPLEATYQRRQQLPHRFVQDEVPAPTAPVQTEPPLPSQFDPINADPAQQPAPSEGAADLGFQDMNDLQADLDLGPPAETNQFSNNDAPAPIPTDPETLPADPEALIDELDTSGLPPEPAPLPADPQELMEELNPADSPEGLPNPFADENLGNRSGLTTDDPSRFDEDYTPPSPRGSLAGENFEDDDDEDCGRTYNGRNCCRLDRACENAWRNLQEQDVTKVSLDTSPPFLPFEDDAAKAAELQEKRLSRAPSREWYDREGNMVRGKLESFRYNRVVIRTDDGEVAEVPVTSLDSDELCFATSWWNLPPCCELPTDTYHQRHWTPITYTWTASASCSKPLYFEEVALERYGHSAGPFLEPLVSATQFYANFFLMPYRMGLYPPTECRYPLGHYRPGGCAPWLLPAFPLSTRAAAAELGAILGFWGFFN